MRSVGLQSGLTRAHVLGAGALGTLWAAHLAAAGVKTTLLLRRRPPTEKMRLHCVAASSASATVDLEHIDGPGRPITTLIVATKAFDVRAAIASVMPRLDHGAPSAVIYLGNGALAMADDLRLPPTTTLLAATTTHGARLLAPPAPPLSSSSALDGCQLPVQTVVHSARGHTWVGEFPRRGGGHAADGGQAEDAAVAAAASAARLSHGLGAVDASVAARERADKLLMARRRRVERALRGFAGTGLGAEVESLEATERRLWLSLAASAALQPLTALWDVQTAAVLERLEGRHLVRETVREISALALALAARGLSTAAPSAEECDAWCWRVAASPFLADQVDSRTMDDDSSPMWVDFRRRNARTEIEELNGWVVARASALGLPCVHNAWLARSIRKSAGIGGAAGQARGVR